MPTLEKAEQILSDAYNVGKLHHAILLYGHTHADLENLANCIASKLFGKEAKNHPDLFELRPEGKMRVIRIGSDSDKVGGEWPKNTMRSLLQNLRQSSYAGGAKVAIVHEADRMNLVTANAFLKTLEEPPKNTTIFMLTSRPNDLLDTIRSRCISLKVDSPASNIADDEWIVWLKDYSDWQKDLMRRQNFSPDSVIMRVYALLTRFDCILTRLADELIVQLKSNSEFENLDAESREAILAGERRGLRKKMFSQIEDTCVSCALGGAGVPAVKLARVTEILEQSAGYMELNMNETIALEYFLLTSIRIWTR